MLVQGPMELCALHLGLVPRMAHRGVVPRAAAAPPQKHSKVEKARPVQCCPAPDRGSGSPGQTHSRPLRSLQALVSPVELSVRSEPRLLVQTNPSWPLALSSKQPSTQIAKSGVSVELLPDTIHGPSTTWERVPPQVLSRLHPLRSPAPVSHKVTWLMRVATNSSEDLSASENSRCAAEQPDFILRQGPVATTS